MSTKVAAKRLAFLLFILEVPGSNLCPETGYPDRGFCGFPQSLQTNTGYYLKLGYN
jgi:hypothetical protein